MKRCRVYTSIRQILLSRRKNLTNTTQISKVKAFSYEKLHFSHCSQCFFAENFCSLHLMCNCKTAAYFLTCFHSQRAEMKNHNRKWTMSWEHNCCKWWVLLWRSFLLSDIRLRARAWARKVQEKISFEFNEMCR